MAIDKDTLHNQLAAVFIERGYDGATLAHLSRATGLSKASLYHHFPDGKPEMAMVLARLAIAALQKSAYRHLDGGASDETALSKFVDGFARYVEASGGHCLLAVLGQTRSAHEEVLAVHQLIHQQTGDWHLSLTQAYEARGLKPKKAARNALNLIHQLYGALLNAKMHNSPEVFYDATKRLAKDLLR